MIAFPPGVKVWIAGGVTDMRRVRDDWDGAVLEDLVRSQLGHFSDLIGTRILLEGPQVRLDPVAAQHIGMVFHELATNAGEHGALSVVEGTVCLGWLSSGMATTPGVSRSNGSKAAVHRCAARRAPASAPSSSTG